MNAIELWVDRGDFRNTRTVEITQPELGDGPTRARLPRYLGDNMKDSQIVGVTHWDAEQGAEACACVWRDMLDNKISGRQGIMVSLTD